MLPFFGQSEQSLKSKKCLPRNVPAVSTAGWTSWRSLSSIEWSHRLINISELAVFNPALVPFDVCSLGFQEETGAEHEKGFNYETSPQPLICKHTLGCPHTYCTRPRMPHTLTCVQTAPARTDPRPVSASMTSTQCRAVLRSACCTQLRQRPRMSI